MPDQKSRGGQKQGKEKQPQGKEEQGVRGGSGQHGGDMAEDARRGQQGNQGGFPGGAPRWGGPHGRCHA
ncbi:hypothetical protein ACJEI5_25230, partial [Escherichia coli]